MKTLWSDLRFAARLLIKRPLFTLVAVGSLGLGIGANTTIFSLVNELFLESIPIEEPDQVLALFTRDERIPGEMQLSHLNWRDIAEQNEVFADVGGYTLATLAVSREGKEPLFSLGQLVSENYFEVLGLRAAVGQTFPPGMSDVPGSNPVVVLGHSHWSQQYGADPDVVGRELIVNGHPFTVIGVAPEGFTGLTVGIEPAMYVPFGMNRAILPDTNLNWFETRRGLFVFGFARLEPGVTREQADASLAILAERLEQDYPDDNLGRSFSTLPVNEAAVVPQIRGGLLAGSAALMATVGLVLLIACVNVANLLVARAAERRKEIAMRLALGVERGRLIRQLLTESVLVSLLGGAFGLVLAVATRKVVLAAVPGLPFGGNLSLDLALDPRVLLFTLVLSMSTGLLFGLVPALQASRPDVVSTLKNQESADPGNRWLNPRNTLVVAQLALSLVALLGSGLFVRSLIAAQEIDLGFAADELLVVNFDLGLAGYDQPRAEQFYREVVEQVAAFPDVSTAAVAAGGPLQGTFSRSLVLPDASSDQARTFVQVNSIGPGYFETMGIPIVDGRAFTDADRADAQRTVIINQTMAQLLWPDENALGREFAFFGMAPQVVVGVAKDIKYNTPGEDPQPYASLPLAQQHATAVALIARTARNAAATDPATVLPTVQRQVRNMDPLIPIGNVSTVPDLLSNALFAPRFAAIFLGVLGLLALVLSAIGVYGVMAYAVARRTKEIGIRVALGADRGSVLGLVLRQGLTLACVGLAVGLVLGFGATRLLGNILYVSASDPMTFAGTSLMLLLVALLAVLIPALKAIGLDPIQVLRAP